MKYMLGLAIGFPEDDWRARRFTSGHYCEPVGKTVQANGLNGALPGNLEMVTE